MGDVGVVEYSTGGHGGEDMIDFSSGSFNGYVVGEGRSEGDGEVGV